MVTTTPAPALTTRHPVASGRIPALLWVAQFVLDLILIPATLAALAVTLLVMTPHPSSVDVPALPVVVAAVVGLTLIRGWVGRLVTFHTPGALAWHGPQDTAPSWAFYAPIILRSVTLATVGMGCTWWVLYHSEASTTAFIPGLTVAAVLAFALLAGRLCTAPWSITHHLPIRSPGEGCLTAIHVLRDAAEVALYLSVLVPVATGVGWVLLGGVVAFSMTCIWMWKNITAPLLRDPVPQDPDTPRKDPGAWAHRTTQALLIWRTGSAPLDDVHRLTPLVRIATLSTAGLLVVGLLTVMSYPLLAAIPALPLSLWAWHHRPYLGQLLSTHLPAATTGQRRFLVNAMPVLGFLLVISTIGATLFP